MGTDTVSYTHLDVYKRQIHDYFLAKTIDQLRPGGVAALITTKGTMDKASPEMCIRDRCSCCKERHPD